MLDRLLRTLGFRRGVDKAEQWNDGPIGGGLVAPSPVRLLPPEAWASGPEAGRQPLDEPVSKKISRPTHFRPWTLPITPELEARIRVEIGLVTRPTEDQWKMILSMAPNTYVNAGAGSGKSTTLVLRLLVLHKYLGVPLEHMTVFSFTKNSTRDFRNKLCRDFAQHGVAISEGAAEDLVKTFHSKLLKFALARGGGGDLFDFLGASGDKEHASAAAKRAMEEAGLADLNLKVTAVQEGYFRRAYEEAYRENTAFRKQVDDLYRSYMLRGTHVPQKKKDYSPHMIRKAAAEDLAATERLQGIYDRAPPYPVAFTCREKETGLTFYANAYLAMSDLYVVFKPRRDLLGPLAGETVGALSVYDWLTFKSRLLSTNIAAKVEFPETQVAFDRLLELEAVAIEGAGGRAPVFEFKLGGDLAPKKIWHALYDASTFIESLAVRPTALAAAAGELTSGERHFAALLPTFWDTFERLLEEDGIVRFGNIFRHYSDPSAFGSVPEALLRSMTHVLIDEFQDISPEVVAWIQATFSVLRDRAIDASLLCVGDDYQSIYGFRGSSPQFFIRYPETFRAVVTEGVTMAENFRCGQNIIDCAELILEDIPDARKRRKHGLAQTSEGAGSVSFAETEDPVQVAAAAMEYAKRWRAEHQGEEPDPDKLPVLILARKKKSWDALKPKLAEYPATLQRCIGKLTFHGSKGLEAPFCVLIGDCVSAESAPFRNLAYKLASFPESYDVAQQDESLRLAYVAITRAARECTWFAVPQRGGAFNRAKRHQPQHPCSTVATAKRRRVVTL